MIDRRSLLLTGTLGLGAFAIPGFAATMDPARGFTHGVAAGEPDQTSLLFWTRYVGENADDIATVRVEVSEGPDFARIVAGGEQRTGAWRDGTVKITVEGLRPGTEYHYRFVGPSGPSSPVGRAKTLPADDARSFRAAIFSCSNLGFGWFNAYAHAAARDDLDCAIHLGDYFYEYAPGGYPAVPLPGRLPLPQPPAETIHLADYRLRYASYRSDPDLQALHARLAMIAQWDDHEAANDSWSGGAQNHDPATEGDWNARRSAAIQAYREWMPVSDEPWKAYDIGRLATLFRTETRLLARTRAPEYGEILAGGDVAAALVRFRDGAWQDPAATMLGTQQEHWLAGAMAASVRAGKRWQVVGFGTNLGRVTTPTEALGWISPDSTPRVRGYVQSAVAASRAGLPTNLDGWGGYPAARGRFLRAAQASDANLLVITGDSHNAWAFDLAQDGAAGVEFGGHSVTSPGFESALATDPGVVAAALVRGNPELAWCDTARRGYMAMTLTPGRAVNEWLFVDTVRTRSPAASIGHRATVLLGRNTMSA